MNAMIVSMHLGKPFARSRPPNKPYSEPKTIYSARWIEKSRMKSTAQHDTTCSTTDKITNKLIVAIISWSYTRHCPSTTLRDHVAYTQASSAIYSVMKSNRITTLRYNRIGKLISICQFSVRYFCHPLHRHRYCGSQRCILSRRCLPAVLHHPH